MACKAITNGGTACRRVPIVGEKKCWQHFTKDTIHRRSQKPVIPKVFEGEREVTIKLPKIDPPPHTSKESDSRIKYDFYPFSQDNKIAIEKLFPAEPLKSAPHYQGDKHNKSLFRFLNPKAIRVLSTEFKTKPDLWVVSYSWTWPGTDYAVLLGEVQRPPRVKGNVYEQRGQFAIFYMVVSKKELVSCLIDKSYALQEGDGGSDAYYTPKKFFISNEGHVSSIVVIW